MEPTHAQTHEHPAMSILLLCLGWFLNVLTTFSIEDAYLWTFRIASLVSVCMIIIINRRKVVEELKLMFKKKE